jgi:nucleotide-binding universal stress UspA family protein
MDYLELWGTELLGHLPDDLMRVREVAAEAVQELVKPERTADLKLQTVITEGTPHKDIVKFTEDKNVDLLVLNIQSKNAWERAMLGATAERVIRSAHVPVLSIPSEFSGTRP